MGRDAMFMWLCDAEAQYETIPSASDMSAIKCSSGSFVNLIDVDTTDYRQQNDTRAIKTHRGQVHCSRCVSASRAVLSLP